MRRNLAYQNCLIMSESVWAIHQIFDCFEQYHECGIAFYNEMDHLSFSFYPYCESYTLCKEKIDNAIEEQKRLRDNYKECKRNQNSTREALKIASTTPIGVIKLLSSKIVAPIFPIIFSIWLAYVPGSMMSSRYSSTGRHFNPSKDSFYLTEGFLEVNNLVWKEDNVKISAPPTETDISPSIEPPSGLRIIQPSDTMPINQSNSGKTFKTATKPRKSVDSEITGGRQGHPKPSKSEEKGKKEAIQ